MKKSLKAFGELYMISSFFVDDANQTMGLPLVNRKADFQTTAANRRYVSDRLTEAGQAALKKLLEDLSVAIGTKVTAKWDIHCGCGMCPCSPGFRLRAKIETPYHRFTEDDRFNIYIRENGAVEIRRPKYLFRYTDQDKFESIVNLYDTKTRKDS